MLFLNYGYRIRTEGKGFESEQALENGQEMIDFMYDEDYTNHDDNSVPSSACSDSNPLPYVLILYL